MIGVFGGTGFYDLIDGAREVEVETPYGAPSSPYMVGTIEGVEVAFLPRHGQDHQFPPHLVPFRANVWGMKELGAHRIIGPCAVGSLHLPYEPGHFVVADNLIDRTWGRPSTFFDGPDVQHLPFADPFCEPARQEAVKAAAEAGVTAHDGGTNVIIQGPRFSTRAESKWFAAAGAHIINMTQIPEVPLTREAGLCYVNISVVTDYDVGVAPGDATVTHDEVLRKFDESLDSLKRTIHLLVPRVVDLDCSCQWQHV